MSFCSSLTGEGRSETAPRFVRCAVLSVSLMDSLLLSPGTDGLSGEDTDAGLIALSTAHAVGGAVDALADEILQPRRARDDHDQKEPSPKCHSVPQPFRLRRSDFTIVVYYGNRPSVSGICNSRRPKSGSIASTGPGRGGRGNSCGSTVVPSSRGRVR